MAIKIHFLNFEGLVDVFTIVKSMISKALGNQGVVTEGDGTAYTATVPGIKELTAGVTFMMIPHTVSTVVNPTLDVNGLGAKNIRRRLTNSTVSTTTGSVANWLGASKPIRVTFDGSFWIADLDRPNAADIYGTVDITNGGTGATTADAARAALGITPDNIGALPSNGTAAEAERLQAPWVSGSLLEFALNCGVGLTSFIAQEETTDLPPNYTERYRYGTGTVFKRSSNFICVELNPYNATLAPRAVNTYNGGWHGWVYDYSGANKPTASEIGALDNTGGTVTGTLVLSKTDDASGTSNTSPALIVGGTAKDPHIAIDANEIIAKADETTPTYLYLGEVDPRSVVSISGVLRMNNINFGTTLPEAGEPGRIFFKKV